MNATTANDPTTPHLSVKARQRNLWLTIHRWLGIALLVPLAVLGVTGSALVWPAETEMLVYPDRRPASEAADGATFQASHVANARDALDGFGPIAAIRFGDVGYPMMIGAAPHAPPHWGIGPPTRMAAYVDPDTGEVLDVTESTGGFMWYMHAAHGHLLLKGIGRPVVGVMGILLLISAISGIYIWWPGRRRVFKALRWQKREGKALNLHKQSGIILSLVLVVEGATGVWISFPAFFSGLVEPGVQSAGHHHRGSGGKPLETADADWADMLTLAQRRYEGRPVMMSAPTTEEPAWQLMLVGQKGPAAVSISDTTREVELDFRAQKAGRADKVEHAMEAVHFGSIGGPVWQWLVFLSGFVLAFLSLTGIYVWAKRKASAT